MSFAHCRWLNTPSVWRIEDENLWVVTDAKTDFWRRTHYGFTRDNGHFFAREVVGDFTAQIRVQARYEGLYDQAGIMIRIDQRNWIKAGIEWSDGQALLSSVLTIEQSDWAASAYGENPTEFWIRSTVKDNVLRYRFRRTAVNGRYCVLPPFPVQRHIALGQCVALRSDRVWECTFPTFRSGRLWTKNCTTCPEPKASRFWTSFSPAVASARLVVT
jgi:uncharacterized protein